MGKLIDAEALKKAIFNELTIWILQRNEKKIKISQGEILNKFEDLIDSQPSIREMFSANKILPEEGVEVLIYNESLGYMIGWIEEGIWRTNDFDIDDDYYEITHWSYLPYVCK